MAEESARLGGLPSGLAVILNNEDGKENSKTHLLSYCNDFGNQPLERALEYIFNLPNKTVGALTAQIDTELVGSLIESEFLRSHASSSTSLSDGDGACVVDNLSGSSVVGLEELSVCGDIRIIKAPFLVESLALFSSVRANIFVWKGKWMYEVILETSGVQQLGWATLSCPFTDHKGVGDADDSYAYDGKRISKWNMKSEPYGQAWVVGDVIGCCIDLDNDEILFYRNGISLGVAFHGIRKMGPGFGYYPAISLSQGERCELNFGARPFKYPILGFLPLQVPPCNKIIAAHLLQPLSRLLDMQRVECTESSLIGKYRRLKSFVSLEEFFPPVCRGICEKFLSVLDSDRSSIEYVAWGPFLSFMMDVFRMQAPHDYSSLDRFMDIFLKFRGSDQIFEHLISALSYSCKTAPMVLTECPYSGSYPYLALACHILRREEMMSLWWKSSDFDFLFEGFLSQKNQNKQDFQCMMPSVWWPGCSEDISYGSSMTLTTTALSETLSKIEEKHRDLCLLVIRFIPPSTPPQSPGSVFRTFIQNLLLKKRGADRNIAPYGVSSNSVLISLYTVILHFLSEGFPIRDVVGSSRSFKNNDQDVGFLHRGGEQSFPADLFLKNESHRTDISRLGGSYSHLMKSHPVCEQEDEVIRWEEGCMDDEESRVTHTTIQKPCCCSSYDSELSKILKFPLRNTGKGSRVHCSSIPERPAHVAAECSTGSLNDAIADKPSTSDQSDSDFEYHPIHLRTVPIENKVSSAILREEELLDTLLLLYHIGVAQKFKQASYYLTHQTQSITLLEETDKQIREQASSDQLRHLKEVRNDYREEVINCVRHCTWYRISLSSRWKQRGMYATCMWIVQLLLVLSKVDSLFIYIPEFYLETLVDCFHVLRKSDPPFVPSRIFIKQGLASFVTFAVSHFDDPRILSADLRDLLLQSISVLVQYKEYLAAFEHNEAAKQRMPKALLSAFDNRSWIPVTNILLRLFKGSRVGSSRDGESSSSSVVFQNLLREACISNTELFSAFLNRLFNTLSWTMTEFSVSIREMQEKYQVLEFQQRKCCVVFDLSCNLTRVLEFCTREIPQAFLSGPVTNLRRLTELVVFILNHITSAADAEFFDLLLRRHGQSSEKVNRVMILAPLVGIILNLLESSREMEPGVQKNDVVDVFASMDCPDTVHYGFQYILDYNWAGSSRGDLYVGKLGQIENFLNLLISRVELQQIIRAYDGETDADEGICCICYTCEADAQFAPCFHRSCHGCITRHLLNCNRCFFCNAPVLEVTKISEKKEYNRLLSDQ